MNKSTTINIISAIFVIVFLYASFTKLLDYQKFFVQISKSPVLTKQAKLFSILTPSVEIILSIALIIDRLRSIALYASFCLMVMFTTYIVIILNFSPFIPCSCGGILQSMNWNQHLIFNIFLILLALIAILLLPAKANYAIKKQKQITGIAENLAKK